MVNEYKLQSLFHRIGPLFHSEHFRDLKDPCPVYDGKQWHIFGSGGTAVSETWQIAHAVAPHFLGPWRELRATILLEIYGRAVAAPGVMHDGRHFHMFIQTNCFNVGGVVEHLISTKGRVFYRIDTALHSLPGTNEAGIYDPHPAIIKYQKYLIYSGMRDVGQPDLYLAKSPKNSWYGPWQRLGKILSHEEVEHHNQRGDPEYEWGLEGAQLIELPNSKILLNAVCFLPDGQKGTRQRLLMGVADRIKGPYRTIGPLFDPARDSWGSGENGHGAAVIYQNKLILFYQARPSSPQSPWRYGLATCDLAALEDSI